MVPRRSTRTQPRGWTPDQQRTTPQVRRAAQHPGNAARSDARAVDAL